MRRNLIFVFLTLFIVGCSEDESTSETNEVFDSWSELTSYLSDTHDSTLIIKPENNEEWYGTQISNKGFRPITITEFEDGYQLEIVGAYNDTPSVQLQFTSDADVKYELQIAQKDSDTFENLDYSMDEDYVFNLFMHDKVTSAKLSVVESYEVISNNN
ncbi:hypothetical protein ACE1TH_06230 [Shouchella sp. JSM 1781072]|uniref:hypothetical protein n=1 Tax=Shouchella sp. JSM 1781072 TaxID=3344581 RepID=UPI0035C1EDAC